MNVTFAARISALTLAVTLTGVACGGKKPPVPNAPPPAGPPVVTSNPAPPDSVPPPAPPPLPPMIDDAPVVSRPSADWNSKKVDEINAADGPLRPVFFLFDSDELDDAARKVLAANAEVLKTYPRWAITIEGHADERGTAEYNLSLGDRRALVTKSYLQSIGIQGDRLRTVSYGKEFPFDAGHSEASWANNRRAQLMVTSK